METQQPTGSNPSTDLARPLDDPDRLAAIDATHVLEGAHAKRFERLTSLAASMLGAPQCSLCIVLPDRQVLAAHFDRHDETLRQTPLEYSFCRYVVESGAPLVVHDAREHPVLRDNPAVAKFGSVAYLGLPLVSPEGQLVGTFCVIDHYPRAWGEREIELIEAFARVAAAELQLSATAARSGERISMAAVMAMVHELRTPLTSISGFSSTLATRWDTLPDDQRREFVEVIDEQAHRLSQLIDDLLTRGQLDSGMLEPRPEPVRVRGLFAEVSRQFQTTRIVIDADETLSAWCDRGQLEQMIVNLVSNALKYGAEPIELRAALAGDRICISVRDHGDGVDERFRDRLFERYARGISRSAKGSGLGLWIVRELAEQNDGSCEYRPSSDGGACFEIELPAARQRRSH